jgi:hypothetical protein
MKKEYLNQDSYQLVDTHQKFSDLAVTAFSAIMSKVEVFGGLGHALLSKSVWDGSWMVSVGAGDSNLDEIPVQTIKLSLETE